MGLVRQHRAVVLVWNHNGSSKGTLIFAEQARFKALLDPSSKQKTQPKTDLYTASFVHRVQWEFLP